MSVNNNSYNYNAPLIENENTELKVIEQDDGPSNPLPPEMFEKVLERLDFVGWQKFNCLNKEWNHISYFSAVRLNFSHIQSFANEWITRYEEHCKTEINDEQKLIDIRNINKIKDLLNIASKVLNFSITEKSKYLSTHKEDLTYLENAQKSLYKHNTKSLIDVELTLHTLMSSITSIVESNGAGTSEGTLSHPIKSMFKINRFNKSRDLTHNINVNYFKLLAIKNNHVEDVLAEIKDTFFFQDLFYSLMSSKHFDLAKLVCSKIHMIHYTRLSSYLAKFGYLESALEWLKTEKDYFKKKDIALGIISGLFFPENGFSMDIIFETLAFIIKQKIEIESSLDSHYLNHWFKKYEIKKTDNIDFAIKTASQFFGQTIMSHGLFLLLIKLNPIDEIYNSEIVNQIIPDSGTKHEVLVEKFFSNFFEYEKTMEIANFIPTDFYYKKQDFLLELADTNKVNSTLKKYSSPEKYIRSLINEGQADKFLTFFNEVPKDVYQKINDTNSNDLTLLGIMLAENGYREKAKELIAMTPDGQFRQFFIKKYNLH